MGFVASSALSLVIAGTLAQAGCGGEDLVPSDLGGGDLTEAAILDLGLRDADAALPSPDLAAPDLATAADLALDPCDVDGGTPPTLACTGLYASFAQRTLAPEVRAFKPGHELWSDGAHKQRYLYLPPGTRIDVSNLDDFSFPVGTKLWKELSLTIASVDRTIETRFLWKRGAGDWVFATYRWNEPSTEATRLTDGLAAVPGTSYEIPAEDRCPSCHHDHLDAPLGVGAVLLASPGAQGLTWAKLQAEGRLTATNGNASTPAASLQIPGNAIERAAIGYLHANCGIVCHRYTSVAPYPFLVSAITGTTPYLVEDTAAFQSVNAPTVHVLASPPYPDARYYRIRPLDPSRSYIHLRMSTRDALPGMRGWDQMPPIVSHAVDPAGLAAIDAWITSMSAAPYPAPAPP